MVAKEGARESMSSDLRAGGSEGVGQWVSPQEVEHKVEAVAVEGVVVVASPPV